MKSTRKLSRQHFAFMRALAQGLDARDSWERYLLIEGEHTDVRTVRRTIAWIRDEFSAAARRQGRPGTSRLVLMDPQRLGGAQGLPCLAEFAASRGMEEFSEAEQAEAFAEAFGVAAGANSRRARLVDKQLAALRWLEELVAQDPAAADPVSAWLSPGLAGRIERAGMPTLFALIERINGVGARWWTGVPGVGVQKAARIVDWLRSHEPSIGRAIGAHVGTARTQLQPAELAAVVPVATSITPLEKFLLPAALDGRDGRFRAARDQCLLGDINDLEAIYAWLSSKRPGSAATASGSLGPTQRAYRKEAERLLLWAILERGKPLSSLTVQDASAYADFLHAPPPSWCGPRHRQRWSPLWRPLEGALSVVAMRQAMTILRSLYAFLVQQNYLVGNPFAAVAQPRITGRRLGSGRTLSFAQWDALDAGMQSLLASGAGRRRVRAVRWLYATGLRVTELANARCGELQTIDFLTTAGVPASGWLLTVLGKGDKIREVPVPATLIAELSEALQEAGQERDPRATGNAAVPILANLPDSLVPWTASGLYKAVKDVFEQTAQQLDGADAERLRLASPHWLRHTHGSHAVNGRVGHAPVPLQVAQNNLGHSSIGTTSGYLTTELEARVQAMEGFWQSKGLN